MTRRGAWHAAWAVLVSAAAASLLAWWWQRTLQASSWSDAAWALSGLAALGCASGQKMARTWRLRWDRQQWWVAFDAVPERAGELAVAIDLGAWMLLRFTPGGSGAGRGGRWRPQWIALHRRGLEAEWHALRCTLYAPRPAALPDLGSCDV